MGHNRLTRHHNYKEYWVCGACNRPLRKRLRTCSRCGSDEPPRILITHRRGYPERFNGKGTISKGLVLVGDSSAEDSLYSRNLFKLTALAKREGGISAPIRELLRTDERAELRWAGHWTCRLFVGDSVYVGTFARDICLFKPLKEALSYMSAKKMMQIRIPSDLHKWLKLHAAKNDTTMTDIIISYVTRLKQKSEASVKVDQI